MHLDERFSHHFYSYMYFGIIVFKIISINILFPAGCRILVGYNLAAALLYLGLGIAILKVKNPAPVFVLCTMEIIINSILSSVLIGQECGYMSILMSTAMVAPFLVYTEGQRNVRQALSICLLVPIAFALGTWLRYMDLWQLYEISRKAERQLYVVNSVIAISVLLGFICLYCTRIDRDYGHMENKAHFDALTKLHNRQYFDQYMAETLKRSSKTGEIFSILMCDIDDFKKINDTYGHEAGDQVLREVAERMAASLRSDDMIFRWGGEEIVILVKGDEALARLVGERCLHNVSCYPIRWNDKYIMITLTIGASTYIPGDTAEGMLAQADANLYQGKTNGKNQLAF